MCNCGDSGGEQMIQSLRSYTGYKSSGHKGGATASSIDKELRYVQRRQTQAKRWKKLKEEHDAKKG